MEKIWVFPQEYFSFSLQDRTWIRSNKSSVISPLRSSTFISYQIWRMMRFDSWPVLTCLIWLFLSRESFWNLTVLRDKYSLISQSFPRSWIWRISVLVVLMDWSMLFVLLGFFLRCFSPRDLRRVSPLGGYFCPNWIRFRRFRKSELTRKRLSYLSCIEVRI